MDAVIFFAIVIVAILSLAAVPFYFRGEFRAAHMTTEQRTWAKQIGGRLGVFPPMREPLGKALVFASIAFASAAVGAAFFLSTRASSPLYLLALLTFLWTKHRNLNWMHDQPDFQALTAKPVPATRAS